MFSIPNISINAIGAAVPMNKIHTIDLPNYSDEEKQKLIDTLGIETRRVSLSHQCASDLCIEAANKLIEELNWDKNDIHVLVFVSQTPDYILPGSSLHIQHRLGLSQSCVCIDINQGCAGYVYGLSVISSLMSATGLSKGLLLVGDTITKLISPDDKSLVPLFSDAGSATALSFDTRATKMIFNLSSEGKYFDAIKVSKGGGRDPFNTHRLDTESNGHHNLIMKGLDVFNFSLKKVVPNAKELLEFAQISKEELDFIVFHQANLLIVESLGKKIGVPMDKIPLSLKHYGNTSSASIPLTIASNTKSNKEINAQMLLSGFGVGLSLGSVIVNLKNVICPKIIECA